MFPEEVLEALESVNSNLLSDSHISYIYRVSTFHSLPDVSSSSHGLDDKIEHFQCTNIFYPVNCLWDDFIWFSQKLIRSDKFLDTKPFFECSLVAKKSYLWTVSSVCLSSNCCIVFAEHFTSYKHTVKNIKLKKRF